MIIVEFFEEVLVLFQGFIGQDLIYDFMLFSLAMIGVAIPLKLLLGRAYR